jgi:hypothetical protein
MEFIIHRVNTIKELLEIPQKFGVEIDIRANGKDLVLNHEPFQGGELLNDYLDHYRHGTLILNIKESGIEKNVLEIMKQKKIKNYFLLDCEYPYILTREKSNFLDIAVRFSCEESIDTVQYQIGNLKWVWIDTFHENPIRIDHLKILKNFSTCMVCPSRWGLQDKIPSYINLFDQYNWKPNAVMTSLDFYKLWEN